MQKILLLFVLFTALLFGATASASQNAGSAWNQFAALHSFAAYPQSSGATFASAYSGSNFALDFAAILARVSQVMGTHTPTLGGDDAFNANLENWPDQSGL